MISTWDKQLFSLPTYLHEEVHNKCNYKNVKLFVLIETYIYFYIYLYITLTSNLWVLTSLNPDLSPLKYPSSGTLNSLLYVCHSLSLSVSLPIMIKMFSLTFVVAVWILLMYNLFFNFTKIQKSQILGKPLWPSSQPSPTMPRVQYKTTQRKPLLA